MGYKLIASDLDETLIGHDRKINQRNLDAIRKFTEQGGKFVPTTGRGFVSIQEDTLETLGLRGLKDQYTISYNGGMINENDGKLFKLTPLPFDLAQELFKRGLTYPVGMHVYTPDTVYVMNMTDEMMEVVKGRLKVTVSEEKSLDFLRGQQIVKILYDNPDFAYLKRIRQNFEDVEDQLEISYSSNRYLEFNPKGVDKGTGLKFLCEKLGIDIKDTIAIGDNFNDLAMIKAAGLGAGVANVDPDVAKDCDYVAESDCDQGGVAEIIEKFALK